MSTFSASALSIEIRRGLDSVKAYSDFGLAGSDYRREREECEERPASRTGVNFPNVRNGTL